MSDMHDFKAWPQAGRDQLQSVLLKGKARYKVFVMSRIERLEQYLNGTRKTEKSRKVLERELADARQILVKLSE